MGNTLSFLLSVSATGVMFSLCLFVCLFVSYQDYATINQPIFTKLDVKMTLGPQKNPLDFWWQSESRYISVRIRVRVTVDVPRHTPQHWL